ncbi:uncharacterized protein cd164l2 isoform X2 [Syngnathoides biaculeatus]|uniref:uncharacterized protein cd164l2 isoform X2 n=1 Tax=Syngnathoides biaculeatus TaxID=300417 RepID=UPI002ADE25CC|nr:uncharacterized protein cd164l2 isoform X2 [Syngnathoides biaculeatus]
MSAVLDLTTAKSSSINRSISLINRRAAVDLWIPKFKRQLAVSINKVKPVVYSQGLQDLLFHLLCVVDVIRREPSKISSSGPRRIPVRSGMQNPSVTMFFCTGLLLVAAAMSSVRAQAGCAGAQSCDLCVGDSVLNLTGCVWRLCPDGDDTGRCVTDEGDVADGSANCSWTRVSELCTESSLSEATTEGRRTRGTTATTRCACTFASIHPRHSSDEKQIALALLFELVC